MAKTIGQKDFGAELPKALVDKFSSQVDRMDSKKKRALAAAIELWVSLPDDLRIQLLSADSTRTPFEFIAEHIASTPNYGLPAPLVKEWRSFHSPSKDYQPSIAGALLLYMIVEPIVREQLRKLAFEKNIKNARIEARKILRKVMTDAYLTSWLGDYSDEDKAILLATAEQVAKSLSRNK